MTMTESMTDRATGLGEVAAARAAACLFRGMGDPSRMAILGHLIGGEHNVAELTAHLGLAQSTVSKHLTCLRDCGLVESRPHGRASVFSIPHRAAVLSLLVAAEELLAATGDAVTLCPTATGESPDHTTEGSDDTSHDNTSHIAPTTER